MGNTLFSYFRSSCSYRVRLALNYKGIAYETKSINLIKGGGEQYYIDFKNLNPHAQIPFWIDDKIKLSQSMAILQYLDATYLQKPMFPEDPQLKFHCIELCELINSGVQPLQNLSTLNQLKSRFNASEEDVEKWVQYFISQGLISYEKLCSRYDGPFSLGEQLSAADFLLIPQVYNANRFKVDLSQMPRINSIIETLKTEAFVIASHPDNQPDTPENL